MYLDGMLIDTAHIRTFLAVANSGSFTAAAADLCCVQSNVTARVRQLEERLGVALFERGRHGAKPTSAGLRFRHYAEQIVALLEDAEDEIKQIDDSTNPLRLGAMENTAATRLPPFMKRLHEAFPQAPLSLQTGTTDELLSSVLEKKIDAAFISAKIVDERLASERAFLERMVVVRPADRPVDRPLIAFRQGCSYRSLSEQWLRSAGLAPVPIVEMGSIDGILGCVASGMGIAVMPRITVEQSMHRDDLDLEDLAGEWRDCETQFVWRKDLRMSRTMQALHDWIKSESKKPSHRADGSP